jgi:alpha-aminoadipate carrier protein LysW
MEQNSTECPTCAGAIPIAPNTEVSEILVCPECHNRAVVVSIDGGSVKLEEAPVIEEDWGE